MPLGGTSNEYPIHQASYEYHNICFYGELEKIIKYSSLTSSLMALQRVIKYTHIICLICPITCFGISMDAIRFLDKSENTKIMSPRVQWKEPWICFHFTWLKWNFLLIMLVVNHSSCLVTLKWKRNLQNWSRRHTKCFIIFQTNKDWHSMWNVCRQVT